MTNFTVWKFDAPDGADRAFRAVKGGEDDGLVQIVDHAIVSWPEGAKKPSSHGSHDDTAKATGWGAVCGLLVGALFFLPVLGAAAGAVLAAITQSLSGVGISAKDIERMKKEIVPGTSALFIVTEPIDPDRLGERLHGVDATLVSTNLTDEERDLLLESFGGR